jgi:hypothetical protein
MSTTSTVDVTVENHGTLFLFRLRTEAAREWVEANVGESTFFGGALVCEHRFALSLAEGMLEDGLAVE